MTHDEIRAVITSDTALHDLVPDTHALASAISQGRTTLGLVSRATFAGWAAKYGMRSKIQDFANTDGHPLRDSSLAIIDVLQGAAEGIDFGLDENYQILMAWVSFGVLDTAHKDILIQHASYPEAVSEFDVRCAIFADDGTLRV